MKMKFKAISLLLAMIMIISNQSIVSASTQNYRDRATVLLLGAGMSQEDIDKLPAEKIIDVSNSTSVLLNTTYLKVQHTNIANSCNSLVDNSVSTITTELSKDDFYNEVEEYYAQSNNDISTYDNNPTYTANGYLKQSILFLETTTKYKYDITYIAEWVVPERPYDRGTDVFGFYVKNGTKIGNVSAFYRAKAGDYNQSPILNHLEGSLQTSLEGAAVSCPLNLWSTDNYLYMSYDVTVDDINQNCIYVIGQYYHQQKDVSFNPTFTVSSSGISITGTIKQVESMVLMKPNPDARYDFK